MIETNEKLKAEFADEGTLVKNIKELTDAISKDQEDISNYGIKLEVFNGLLARFLGRDEISLELYDSSDGAYYRIVRDGSNAKNLSEGEKTAIAFIFFITKLQEEGFELSNGVVVIDDPVSSLDSTFLFNAFSFLRDQVKLAKQLFIFTHNFSFLRLVTRWFEGVNEGIRKKNKELKAKGQEEKPLKASFYMIRNDWEDGKRFALLEELDPFLHGYQTEYEFIYKELKQYVDMTNKPLEHYYNVPNLARKLLEIFFEFKHPGKLNLKDRLDREASFDQVTRDKIFNFVNFHSHAGSDRSQGVDMSFLGETPEVIKNIFELLEHVDTKHVERMNKLVG